MPIKNEKPIQIQKKKLLLVEGNDEVVFFQSLFKEMNVNSIQIYPVGGKEQFRNEIPLIVKHREFNNVTKIGCIRDADEDKKAAFDSISNVLVRNGLKPVNVINKFSKTHPSIGIFIMPGVKHDKGALEDLCTNAICNDKKIECVDDYIACIELKLSSKLDKITKRKAQVYLAANKDLCNSVGLGAQKNYWNFNSHVYDELKDFINNLNN